MWLNENLFNIITDDYSLSKNELLLAKDYIQWNLFQMKIVFREDVSTLKWYLFNKPFYFEGHTWTLALKYLILLKEDWKSIDDLDKLSINQPDNININEENTKIDELTKDAGIKEEADKKEASLLSENIKNNKI